MKRKLSLFLTLFTLWTGLAMAQTQVQGTVVDETGEPVIGASVIVKSNPSQGTITDIDGKFALAVNAGETLTVSYVGYKTQDVAARPDLRVTLVSDTEVLQELVVTAMGLSRDKKTIGYSAQEVKADDLQKTRQTDLNNALVGKVSGVKYSGASGATFDAGSIVLRGTTSLDPRGNSPIYVVDGVITDVNSINMDDVSAVNVLKGPAATALYGSRGGNGAIIITTKGLSGDRQEINVSHTLTFEEVYLHAKYQTEYGGGQLGANGELPVYKFDAAKDPAYLQKLDGARYYDMNNDVSWGPKFNTNIMYAPWYAWDPTDPRFGQQTPWVSSPADDVLNLYRTGIANTSNLSFGRSGKDYMVRVSYTNSVRKGVLPNSDAVRRFLGFKTSYKASDKLNISLDYKYTYRENHNGAAEGYGTRGNASYTFQQWFNRNVFVNDLRDYKRPDGTFRTWNINSITDLSAAYHNNPFTLFHEINDRNISQWNVFNANATYDITNKLKASLIVNGNIRNYKREISIPQNVHDVASSYSMEQYGLIDMQYQGMLSYGTNFMNGRMIWDANLFAEMRNYRYDQVEAFTRDGLFLNNYFSIQGSSGLSGGRNEKINQQDKSVFGTTSLSLDDTYFMELSLRNDWTSTLSPKHNSYLYGGGSLSVLAHKWIRTPWLNFWKLRASAAQVGSTLSPYRIYPVFIVTDANDNSLKYGQLTEMQIDRNLKKEDIKPTISTSFEVGTEFRLFNNRVWGDFNFYRRDSRNQIINIQVAPQSGYTSRVENVGLIRNEGVELTLGADVVKTKDWTWTLEGNVSKNNNVLMELTDNVKQYELDWYSFSNKILLYAEVGKPIGVIRGTDFARDPNGNIILNKRKVSQASIDRYGEYDIALNQDESTYLGNMQPKLTGGFSTSLEYKGIRLGASFDFQVGGTLASVSNMFGEGSGLLASTVGKNRDGIDVRNNYKDGGGIYVSGVVNEGTAEAPVYKPIETRINPYLYYAYRKSAVWGPNLYEASYLKMRELSISYTLPAKTVAGLKAGLKALSVSLIAQNPWLIYSGTPNIDPSEARGARYGYVEGGQSYSTRSYGLTLNATF